MGAKPLNRSPWNLGYVTMSGPLYLNFQIWERSGCVGRIGACVKYHCLWLPFFLSFRFFNSLTGRRRHSGPIFTIYTSNDAFSLKEVPFGGLDDEFSHLPPFLPQNLKIELRPMAISIGNNSGTFKDRGKMFAPKWGFGIGQFNGVIEICLRPTLVTMVTNCWFSNTKLAKTQLIQETKLRM